ncbi:uncharacterized protein LOC131429265 [Malaya genurostris]|uniref:uncharacterized protein LOC131429265 n=1 Tax=Malaya genurostris TaxID=325434 RepID=UPI0026F3CDFA|nr:uncharacterized protein LOC131429265 [Malaya genurostris]
MDTLVRERKSLESRLARVKRTLTRFHSSEELEEIDIQTELDNLQEVWIGYLSVHKRMVETCKEDDMDAMLDHLACFEEQCISLKNGFNKLLKRMDFSSTQHEVPLIQNGTDAIKQLAEQQAEFFRHLSANLSFVPQSNSMSTPPANVDHNASIFTDVKLPRMNIPTFSGNILDWPSFYDLFDSAVHKNQSLQNSQKLYFLKTNLSGEAGSLISHLRIEDANYAPALAKLKERYDKPLEIAAQHIQRFLGQPTMSSASAVSLRALHDVSDEVVRALRAMNCESRDIWLLYILVEKLDPDTKQLWLQKRADMTDDEINLDKFLKFIDSHSFALKSVQPIRSRTAFVKSTAKYQPRSHALVSTSQQIAQPMCGFCFKKQHHLYQCGKFINSNANERLAYISRQKLCQNCLKQHTGEGCKSGNCRKCNQPHHTRLHEAYNPVVNQTTISTSSTLSAGPTGPQSVAQSLVSPLNLTNDLVDTNVLLLTATINVQDKYGRPFACRAVLDCASHTSYITTELCNKLNLPTADVDFEFGGISGTSGHASKGALVTISSRCSEYQDVIPCVVLDRITSELPIKPVDISNWPIPSSIHLADPQFHHPGKISMLLGNKLFFNLIEPGTIKLCTENRLPILQNTKLGWVASGGYESSNQLEPSVPSCLLASTDDFLSQQLRMFWELEEYANTKPYLSSQETQCENHFKENTIRDDSGRFIVRLPFLDNPDTLGESREIATKRLLHLERKLDKNPKLKMQYHNFLHEYVELGHMSLTATSTTKRSVFLPHHCVVKEASTTTKCRVVFDASAKTSSGRSLNDILMAGPVLQDSLIDILLRFRFPAIVFTGDIQKMYRMIQLHDDDRDYQRILWRWSKDKPVDEYRLNTVTYGTKSASYLATKCVQELLLSHREQYPQAVEKALKGTYVDDLLVGAETIEEAKYLRQQLTEIFDSAGFHLRKWASNSATALEGIREADLELKMPIEFDDSNTIKALGIHWQPCSDELHFSYQRTQILQPTKRIILSQIASLFDPLGLLAPIIVKAKLIMQQLWELKVAWDATPPGELVQSWFDFVQNLSHLNLFQIPRRVVGTQRTTHLLLHGYSDASEQAMGACVYIRSIDNDGTIKSRLLCAKSKLAPIGNGRTTLPRLELCAAVILARLMKNVTNAIDQSPFEVRAWTDSQVALAWINGGASRWKTFVANRVAEIVTHLPAINWGHINTHLNPADLISRGIMPEQLKNNKLWWDGPNWDIKSGHDTASDHLSTFQQQQINKEQRASIPSLIAIYKNTFLDDMMARYYPNFQKLLRITARMLRLCRSEFRKSVTLTTGELDKALDVYIKHVHKQHYPDEIQCLLQHKDIKRQSTLFQLMPFLDENGILRVGGRIQRSDFDYDTKHPVLLPRHSILTFFVLHHDHILHQNCGPLTLLAVSRRRFWIVRGASAARKVYRQCIVCARAKPAPIYQQMGQLPADRVQPHLPFMITGVDFAGPVSITGRRARGAVASKGYIALFICFSTKAVHLEAVSDLGSSAFIASFIRFTSRYGMPSKMFSDNATNFRAASKQLQEINQSMNSAVHSNQVADFMTNKGVDWNFIPARSPHHGGLWESAIKTAKQYLGKIAGNQNFTFEELSTLLAQVAATMNSRPITPISSNVNDPQPLTPAHFLIGRALTTVPEINMLERNISSLSRWEYIQRLAQEFRSRWQLEYVRSLQRFTKWQRSTKNIVVGDFVILVKDDEKPRQWPLGRVLETFPGPDGLVRVVLVKTGSGTTRRDVRRLRVVPLDLDEYVPGRFGTEIPDRNLVGGLCWREISGRTTAAD